MARPNLRIVPKSAIAVSELELSIREYLLAKKQEGCAAGTLEKYAIRLAEFIQWLANREITRPNQLTRLILREWGASLNDDWSSSTRRHVITIARGFLRWLVSEGWLDDGIPTALKLPKIKRRIQRSLSAEEVKALLDCCDDSSFGRRDAAIVSLMVDSGLRASEVCRLKLDDLIFDFQLDDRLINLVLVIGKGGHQDAIPFGQDTARRLRAWLDVRAAHQSVTNVIVSLGGHTPLKSLTRFGLGQLLRDLGERAGVPDVTPHSLRRTFALMLDDAGVTTRQIQVLGRWSDIRMVELYTHGLKAARFYVSPADRINKKTTK
jgi:site-specific recombinase XerD